jgi:hypothetical protein
MLVISLYLERRDVFICVLSALMQNALVSFATGLFRLSAFHHYNHTTLLNSIDQLYAANGAAI